MNIANLIESAFVTNRRNFIDDNQAKQTLGCILHIGAGNGSELAEYLKLDAERIILVEAIQRVSRKLQQKTQESSVEVINALVSSETTNSIFYELQPVRYSSLKQPEKLKEVFQNLKIKAPIDIDAISLSDLVKEQSLDKDRHNVLVLQTNGAEYQCLESMAQEELSIFSSLVIQTSYNGYFKNPRTCDDIIELLRSKGFQLDIQSSENKVFNDLVFSKDKLAELVLLGERQKTELLEVSHKLEVVKSDSEHYQTEFESAILEVTRLSTVEEMQRKQLAKANANVEELTRINQSTLIDCNKAKLELDTAKTNSERYHTELELASSEVTKLSTAEEKQRKQLVKANANIEELTHINQSALVDYDKTKLELDTAESDSKRYQTELESAASEVTRLSTVEDNQLKQITESAARIEMLLESNQTVLKEYKAVQAALEEDKEANLIERNETTRQRDKQEKLYQENKKWAESLQDELKKKEESYNQQNLSRNLNEKLLAKAMIDADDLRGKFREQKEKEKELVDLIKELREKLALASKYYFQLQQEHPELISSIDMSKE